MHKCIIRTLIIGNQKINILNLHYHMLTNTLYIQAKIRLKIILYFLFGFHKSHHLFQPYLLFS